MAGTVKQERYKAIASQTISASLGTVQERVTLGGEGTKQSPLRLLHQYWLSPDKEARFVFLGEYDAKHEESDKVPEGWIENKLSPPRMREPGIRWVQVIFTICQPENDEKWIHELWDLDGNLLVQYFIN